MRQGNHNLGAYFCDTFASISPLVSLPALTKTLVAALQNSATEHPQPITCEADEEARVWVKSPAVEDEDHSRWMREFHGRCCCMQSGKVSF